MELKWICSFLFLTKLLYCLSMLSRSSLVYHSGLFFVLPPIGLRHHRTLHHANNIMHEQTDSNPADTASREDLDNMDKQYSNLVKNRNEQLNFISVCNDSSLEVLADSGTKGHYITPTTPCTKQTDSNPSNTNQDAEWRYHHIFPHSTTTPTQHPRQVTQSTHISRPAKNPHINRHPL